MSYYIWSVPSSVSRLCLGLQTGDLPIFVTTPNSNGNVIETVAKDILGCLATIKTLHHSRERRVKLEEVDVGVPPDSNTGNCLTRACIAKKHKVDYGDHGGDSESEGSELTDVEAPWPKRKGNNPRFPTPETVPETPSPTKGKEALTTLKKTSAKRVITAAEFNDGDFHPVPSKTHKQDSEPEPHDQPVSKKLKETERADHSTTSGSAAAQGPIPTGKPHPPPLAAECPEQDSDRLSAPPTMAAPPPPHLQPPFQWQTHPYPPAMQGPPHPNAPPPHFPFPVLPPSVLMQASYGGAGFLNMPPEMMNRMYSTLMAQLAQPGPSGYHPASTGPRNR
ncbi:hypothetical protein PQX77_021837 [Marasmius sp. AFHP31]|nr:hypothetical protein PQX77_021837 [Marasmius sp. AFHP31]